ncbi:MAG: ABC transporter ATP-binding protein [Nitrososphaerales archaeon]
MVENLIEVEDLKTQFTTKRGLVKAVDGISFEIKKGEKVGLVGESGCGKSVTALSLMKLVPSAHNEQVFGKILFKGQDLVPKTDSQLKEIRGKQMSMIFQDPMTSLDPVFTIGNQIQEALAIHQGLTGIDSRKRAVELLGLVNIPSSETVVDYYPHQLSGGMRQRAMIAMALSCEPELLIADEPTTALDVSIQAQIIKLIRDLSATRGTSLLWITHDLGIVAHLCEKIIVMYAGKLVEMADTMTLFENPMHPYTQALLRLAPKLEKERGRLPPIPGTVPNLIDMPPGCRFRDRCPKAMEVCHKEPQWIEIENGHWVSCYLYSEEQTKK